MSDQESVGDQATLHPMIPSEAQVESLVLFIRDGRGLLFSLRERRSDQRSAYEQALINLASFVGKERLWWSRAKAYVLESISPSMWGVMKVAGKRLYHISPHQLDALWKSLSMTQRTHYELKPSSTSISAHSMSLTPSHFSSIDEAARWLEQKVFAENQNRLSEGKGEELCTHRRWSGAHRTVAAIVLDSDLKVISGSFNHPEIDHTAHAESLCLEEVEKSAHTQFDQLYLISSLKPCKMCAGLWITYAPTKALRVYYLREDHGANGQNTAFDKDSYAWSTAKRWRCSLRSLSQVKLEIPSDDLRIPIS